MGQEAGSHRPDAGLTLGIVTFLNICETKGNQVQMRVEMGQEASKRAEGVTVQMVATERPGTMWTQRPFDSGIGPGLEKGFCCVQGQTAQDQG